MNSIHNHIIEKQFIDVAIENPIDAFLFKEKVEDICRSGLMPAIEKLFDEKNLGERILRIEKLEINIGNLDNRNWDKEFVNNVIEKLSENIDNLFASSPDLADEKLSLTEKKQEASDVILHFLMTGNLPWFTSAKSKYDLNLIFGELIKAENENFKIKVEEVLNSNDNAIRRFIYQFTDANIELYLKLTGIQITKLGLFWKNIFESMKINFERIKYLIYYASLSSKAPVDVTKELNIEFSQKIISELTVDEGKNLLNLIEDIKSGKKLFQKKFEKKLLEEVLLIKDQLPFLIQKPEDILIKKSEENKDSTIKSDLNLAKEYFINNSGLVLLHPFLLMLFENTGYVKNKNWIDEKAQQRGIALMQFMITGIEEFNEFDLTLNKIICGYEIEKSLPVKILLTENEKNEAEDLLQSVIKHWAIIKDTSIDGLRSAFLMRDGKLTFKNEEWLLQVEQKPYDMLLQHLPWSISMIKLPWMKYFIKTEWIE